MSSALLAVCLEDYSFFNCISGRVVHWSWRGSIVLHGKSACWVSGQNQRATSTPFVATARSLSWTRLHTHLLKRLSSISVEEDCPPKWCWKGYYTILMASYRPRTIHVLQRWTTFLLFHADDLYSASGALCVDTCWSCMHGNRSCPKWKTSFDKALEGPSSDCRPLCTACSSLKGLPLASSAFYGHHVGQGRFWWPGSPSTNSGHFCRPLMSRTSIQNWDL